MGFIMLQGNHRAQKFWPVAFTILLSSPSILVASARPPAAPAISLEEGQEHSLAPQT